MSQTPTILDWCNQNCPDVLTIPELQMFLDGVQTTILENITEFVTPYSDQVFAIAYTYTFTLATHGIDIEVDWHIDTPLDHFEIGNTIITITPNNPPAVSGIFTINPEHRIDVMLLSRMHALIVTNYQLITKIVNEIWTQIQAASAPVAPSPPIAPVKQPLFARSSIPTTNTMQAPPIRQAPSQRVTAPTFGMMTPRSSPNLNPMIPRQSPRPPAVIPTTASPSPSMGIPRRAPTIPLARPTIPIACPKTNTSPQPPSQPPTMDEEEEIPPVPLPPQGKGIPVAAPPPTDADDIVDTGGEIDPSAKLKKMKSVDDEIHIDEDLIPNLPSLMPQTLRGSKTPIAKKPGDNKPSRK